MLRLSGGPTRASSRRPCRSDQDRRFLKAAWPIYQCRSRGGAADAQADMRLRVDSRASVKYSKRSAKEREGTRNTSPVFAFLRGFLTGVLGGLGSAQQFTQRLAQRRRIVADGVLLVP